MKNFFMLIFICISALLLVACEEDDKASTSTAIATSSAETVATSPAFTAPIQTISPTTTIAPTITTAPTETIAPTITTAPTETIAPTITTAPTETIAPTITTAPTETIAPTITTAPTATTKPTSTHLATPTHTTKPTPTHMAPPTHTIKPTPTAQVTAPPISGFENIITSQFLNDIENEFIKLVNIEREAFFLPPLSVNEVLDAAAQIRSIELTANKTHYRPDGSSYKTAVDRDSYYYLWITENLCFIPYIPETFNQTGQEVAQTLFDTFKSSAGHHQNIIFNLFTDCGFGITCAIDESTGYLTFYFCHLLATR